ncbi:MAG: response regulator [Deltaproteobacteria bacterium]|nr:response regulator [Deltaproteobacteria bacterium]
MINKPWAQFFRSRMTILPLNYLTDLTITKTKISLNSQHQFFDLTFIHNWDMLRSISGFDFLAGEPFPNGTCRHHSNKQPMNLPRILIVDDEEEVRKAYLSILLPQTVSDGIDEMASSLFGSAEKEAEMDEMMAFFADDGAEMIVEADLQTGTYEVDQASQGAEAVEKIRYALQENRPFSLMFLDIRMPPGIDGVQAAKEIRQLDSEVEIVIMTAYSDYSYKEIIQTVGNPERLLYYRKPFKSSQILQLASSLTQQWYLERKCQEQDR